ncbi:tetratricopeptide repeat protein [Polaromonas aquatica]|uniref:tetratricopeptide repeat protein n=1 Tax=Polaromonas aquatica TaxID=332657 RepID=UPI003D661B1A
MNDESKNSVTALLQVAEESIERGDARSLSFAIRRASDISSEIPLGIALGTALQHVENVPPSIASGVSKLLKNEAIERCDPLAYYALARLSALGLLGVEKNEERAFEYLKKSADLGSAEANLYLGIYACSGIGCAPDVTVARKAFEQAADAGYVFAQKQVLLMRTDLSWLERWRKIIALSIVTIKMTLENSKDRRLYFLSPKAELWE